jgi:magnesium chelatase family protein
MPRVGGLLLEAAERLRLSARFYLRVLPVARTLADLDASQGVRRLPIAEALSYRRIALGTEALAR